MSILFSLFCDFWIGRMREGVVLISDFYDHPDLYDARLPVDAHLPFYVDLARQQAGAVLELACGTGQLTVPVAVLGLPTVGRSVKRNAQRRENASISRRCIGCVCPERHA